jgi:hypothetical protein
MSCEDEGFRGSAPRVHVIARRAALLERGGGLYPLAGQAISCPAIL